MADTATTSTLPTETKTATASHDAAMALDANAEFPQAARAIGNATALVLEQLNAVTNNQRSAILMLIEAGESTRANASAEATALAHETRDTVQNAHTSSASELLAYAAAQAIATAMHNTVATMQQLDILAQAVLSRAAAQRLDGASQ